MSRQIVGLDDLSWLVPQVQQAPAVVFDFETTGVEPYLGDVPIGLGVSPYGSGYYFYLPMDDHHDPRYRPLIAALERVDLIGHFVKFDCHNLALMGWQPQQERLFCTAVMARIWSDEERPSLDLETLGERLLGFQYRDEHAKQQVQKGRAHKLSPAEAGSKCMDDLEITEGLYRWFKERLAEPQRRLYARESMICRDLYDIERRGQLIDQEYLAAMAGQVRGKMESYLADIAAETGQEEFNPRSSLEVAELMDGLGVAPVKRTKPSKTYPDGQVSWDREALMAVRRQHSITLKFAQYRALGYLASNMIDRCERTVAAGYQALHGTFNSTTVTGRLRSSGPNRQNDPHGWLQFDEDGDSDDDPLKWAAGPQQELSVERLFVARPGMALVTVDYSQIEMYFLGHYMHDKTFDRWLASGNCHRAAAEEVWGDGEKFYDRGKTYNFANVYGQGDKARADSLKLRQQHEAETGHKMRGYNCPTCFYDAIVHSGEMRKDYFSRMPGYEKLQRRVIRALRRDGCVPNMYDRRYYVSPERAYVAVNYLCQGSAGDYVKGKLPETRELRRQMSCAVLKTTHDDFTLELPQENLGGLPELFQELRRSPLGRELNIDVEISYTNMTEMKPYDYEAAA